MQKTECYQVCGTRTHHNTIAIFKSQDSNFRCVWITKKVTKYHWKFNLSQHKFAQKKIWKKKFFAEVLLKHQNFSSKNVTFKEGDVWIMTFKLRKQYVFLHCLIFCRKFKLIVFLFWELNANDWMKVNKNNSLEYSQTRFKTGVRNNRVSLCSKMTNLP